MATVSSMLKSKGSRVCFVGPSVKVYEALEVMAKNNIGAVLVMEDDKLRGIFSERDYARKIALQDKSSKTTPIIDVMTEWVVTVMPDDTVEHCMEIMTGEKIRHLPVKDNGKIVGIISIGDVVNAIIQSQKETITHLQNYISM